MGNKFKTKVTIEDAFKLKDIVGSNVNCPYYPCHFEGQDCTWCFCPFYPCDDMLTGGRVVDREKGGLIWGCTFCFWVHKPKIARRILEEIKKHGKGNISRKELLEIRRKILEFPL